MQKKQNQIKKAALKIVGSIAKNAAVKSANSACEFINHQQVLPKEVRELRKF